MTSFDVVAVRRLALLIASITLLAAIPGVGYGWVETASQATHAQIGSWASGGGPAVPRECAGMTFDRVIIGTSRDDRLRAGKHGDLVFGLGGADRIEGGKGRDCLVGGTGSDRIEGEKGMDVLVGGDGDMALVDVHAAARAWVTDEEMESGTGHDGHHAHDLLDGGPDSDICFGTIHDVFIRCERVRTGRDRLRTSPDPALGPILPWPFQWLPRPTSTPGPAAGGGGDAPPMPGLQVTPTPMDDPLIPEPTSEPTADPTAEATPAPTTLPTADPTSAPTAQPTAEPTPEETAEPSSEPTPEPVPEATPDPTSEPTSEPAP